jgi:dsDNA-binding SOS-regulon protein
MQFSKWRILNEHVSRHAELAKHFCSKIFIPSYSEDKLLDPKRAIYDYLKKAETVRNSDDNVENSLFLAANEPHRPVSTQTMTKIKSDKGWFLRPISCVHDRLHWSTIKKCPRWAQGSCRMNTKFVFFIVGTLNCVYNPRRHSWLV